MSSPGPGQSIGPIYPPAPIVTTRRSGEAGRSLTFRPDFSAHPQYLFDLTTTVNSGQVSSIQSVWIDNSANTQTVTLAVVDTALAVIAAPGSQGYYSLMCPNLPKLMASSAGAAVVTIMLMNVPAPTGTWRPSAAAVVVSGTVTALQGTDPWDIAGTVEIGAGTALIGSIAVAGTVAVSGSVGILGTVPVTGTVSAAIVPGGTVTALEGTSPWIVAGTVELGAGSLNIGTVAIAGTVAVTGLVALTGTSPVSGTVTLAAGAAGVGTVIAQGAAANGAAVAGNPVLTGARAQGIEATAVTNSQAVDLAADLVGRQIVVPYASKGDRLMGNASVTGAGATVLAAVGSKFSYGLSAQLSNNTATGTFVTFNDTAGTSIYVGASACVVVEFAMPIRPGGLTTALTATAAGSTVTVAMQGYSGV